ncbi:MAG: hypothetical protein JRI23_13005, partial [Deltaproteobacteria bacterium]|nr:hypothetical protein [Deltaproteobacteria bacterium]MBW2532637.1 hypothetical protein [Deltaproteobacteria bacterium]
MRWWPVVLLLVAPAALVANCALEQFDNESAPTPTSSTSSSGGGGTGGGAGAGGGECPHESFPAAPDADTADGTLDVLLALRRIYIEDAQGDPVGYDLENLCTCQGQGPSCVAPPVDLDCDAPRGIDNNLRLVFPPLALATGEPDLLGFYSDRAEIGEWSLLMRIRDYNGEANDRQINLSWYLTTGSLATPAWSGDDGWEVSTSSLLAGADGGPDIDSPMHVDENAFVT